MKLIDTFIDYSLCSNLDLDLLYSNTLLPLQEYDHFIEVAISSSSLPQALESYFHKEIHTVIYPKEEILSALEQLEEKIYIFVSFSNNKMDDTLHYLLQYALNMRASDIHIEPFVENNQSLTDIRLRIDGELMSTLKFPYESLFMLTSRIKLYAKMDIVQKKIPQNGRFSINLNHHTYDFRVSSMPLIEEETLVVRILGKNDVRLELDQLGLNKNSFSQIQTHINHSSGLILVCGPTGSGKTTLLYAILNAIASKHKKIITIEDPVEYKIHHTQQIQIDPQNGLSYALALKNILRLDPDIIIIGEIRDYEALKIAVEATLSGHLVIATMHTKNSISTVTRLLDMGMEPYFIAAALKLVISTRLVKKLCPHCLEYQQDKQTYISTGCKECSYRGFKGRTSITESLALNTTLAKQINEHIALENFYRTALNEGFKPFSYDIKEKIEQKLISNEILYQLKDLEN
jgi:general secretion pathway protein E